MERARAADEEAEPGCRSAGEAHKATARAWPAASYPHRMMARSLLLLLACAGQGHAALEAYRLRVEYQNAPRAIDARRPRFSWALRGGRSGQAAYRLSVERAGVVVTDTGRVASADRWAHPLRLAPEADCDAQYSWRLTVWDGANASSAAVGQFGTGLLSADCWRGAKWIGAKGGRVRRAFVLPERPGAGRIHVACPGYCRVWVNGQLVSGDVLGHQSLYERTVLYNTYDLAGMLSSGNNTVAIEIGNGWYGNFEASCQAAAPNAQECTAAADGHSNPLKCLPYCWQRDRGQLGRRSVMVLLGVDGSYVVSDGRWRQAQGTVTYDDIYNGETQDLRLEQAGWAGPHFDDSSWQQVERAASPGGRLVAAPYPLVQTMPSLEARSVTRRGGGLYVFDFGRNQAALIRLELPRLDDLANITITTHEQLNKAGDGDGPYPSTQRFILPASGSSLTVQTKFTYFGFQYLSLACSSWPDTLPEGLVLSAVPVSNGVERTGNVSFTGEAAALLGEIQAATVNSGLSNLVSVPTDCPTRERRGYLGDAQIAADSMVANFDMSSTYRYFIHTVNDSQNSVGSVPAKVPAYPPALYYNNDAGWTVAYPILVRVLLDQYGDQDSVRAHYPSLLKLWANVSTFVPTSGPYRDLWVDLDRDGSWVNGDLGDWCALLDQWPFDPSKENQCHTPSALISTFWLIEFAQAMSRFATLLGQSADPFDQQAVASARALHSHFWNATSQLYSSAGREPPASVARLVDEPPAMTQQALGLWSDATPGPLQQQALAALIGQLEKTDYHLLTGIVGTKFILPVLGAHGRLDVAMKVLTQVTQPSFGFWVSQGLTTLMESWRSDAHTKYGSANHIMFGSVSAFFYKYVAGLRVSSHGPIVVGPQPAAIPQLDGCSATQQLEHGLVAVSWQKHGQGTWALNVSIPPSSSALTLLPLVEARGSVFEGGRLIWADGATVTTTGLASVHFTASNVVQVEHGAGQYAFVVTDEQDLARTLE